MPGTYSSNELDTHADTCYAGKNWHIMDIMNQICVVKPFLDSYEAVTEIPVVRACTVWTHPDTSKE